MLLDYFYKYLPLNVFIGIWGIVFYLYSFQLYNIYPASSDTIFLIFIGILAFCLGYILLAIYDVQKIKPADKTLSDIICPRTLLWLVIGLCLLTLSGTILIFITVANELGGIDAYLRTPIGVRSLFVGYQNDPLTPPPFTYKAGSYLINTGFAGSIFGGVLFAIKDKIRITGLSILVVFLIASVATVGRYTFVNSLFFFIFSYILATFFMDREYRKKRLLEIVFYSIILVALLALFTFFIIEIRTTINSQSAVKEFALKTSYLYLTGGISALDNFLSQDFSLVYGQSSFRSIFRWLIRFDIWPEASLMLVHEPFTSVTPTISINTYTHIKSFFEDFGTVGVLCFSFIFGASCKLTTLYSLTDLSFIRIGIAVTLIFAAFMSFYSFYLHSITTIIYRILVVIILQYLFANKLFK
ncbi:MAG: O-antigen polymerase [Gracilimonas sp.]